MPSMWDVLGETIGETVVGPLIIGGAVVSLVAVPEVRKRVRQWSVQGAAAALAAADAVAKQVQQARQGQTAAGAAPGIVEQLGRSVRRAAEQVREEWDDFVAEVQAAREQRTNQAGEPRASQEAGEDLSEMEEERPRRSGQAPGGEPSEYGPDDLGSAGPPRHRAHRARRPGQG
jgi:hypothetical protein